MCWQNSARKNANRCLTNNIIEFGTGSTWILCTRQKYFNKCSILIFHLISIISILAIWPVLDTKKSSNTDELSCHQQKRHPKANMALKFLFKLYRWAKEEILSFHFYCDRRSCPEFLVCNNCLIMTILTTSDNRGCVKNSILLYENSVKF